LRPSATAIRSFRRRTGAAANSIAAAPASIRERSQPGAKNRDIYVEDRRLDTIKVKARDFR